VDERRRWTGGGLWTIRSKHERKKLGAAAIDALFPDAAGMKRERRGPVGDHVGERRGVRLCRRLSEGGTSGRHCVKMAVAVVVGRGGEEC
jgi:hypothetical protein